MSWSTRQVRSYVGISGPYDIPTQMPYMHSRGLADSVVSGLIKWFMVVGCYGVVYNVTFSYSVHAIHSHKRGNTLTLPHTLAISLSHLLFFFLTFLLLPPSLLRLYADS